MRWEQPPDMSQGIDLQAEHGVTLRPLLRTLTPIAVLGLVGGFATRQPGLVALGAPAAALVMVALVRRAMQPTGPLPEARLAVSSGRISVGEEFDVSVTLRSSERVTRCQMAVKLPVTLEVVEGSAAITVSLEPGQASVHRFRVRATSAGPSTLGPAVVRMDSWSGLFRIERICSGSIAVKVVANHDSLQALLRAATTGAHIGEQLSPFRADGFEFVDMRAYVPGDPAKRIHWRASARTDDPVVIERHPDRNQDVLIVVDAHANLELSIRESTLQRTMEAAATIAGAHLGARDRVGFVGLGTGVSWVLPGSGHMQKYRILDAISSVSTTGDGIGRRIVSAPVNARPKRSLAVVITPLVDDRSVDVIRDLQIRRHDVCVVVIAPFRYLPPAAIGGTDPATTLRIWRVIHEEARHKLSEQGTAVVLWADDTPVELAVREVIAWRRKLRAGRRQTA